MDKAGFEPAKAEPADLQSAHVDRLYTYPKFFPTQTKTPGINRVFVETYLSLFWRIDVPHPGLFPGKEKSSAVAKTIPIKSVKSVHVRLA